MTNCAMEESKEAKKITDLTKGMRARADAIFDSDEKTALLLRHAASQLQKLKMVYLMP